ncbi:TonB-dependent receptor [Novosphingobium sp. JCM 18896]|nr:TonB-dependent receptor [Novosphingobium sp. JCM 18896]
MITAAVAAQAIAGEGGAEQVATPPAAQAESSPPTESGSGLQEIIVTAQKRRQSINDVGLSITAVDGAALSRRQITTVYDLVQVVPGLSIANSGNAATPVYTLRGIGFNSSNLNSLPTVSVYTNEIALPYPVMTQGVELDLERIEVLKGPQGTLFGQSTTAGAINYIAASPTDTLAGGVGATFGRFNQWNVNGFLSGPLGDTVKLRIAASHFGGGDWQKSYTRNDSRGERDKTEARATLEWQPADALTAKIMVSYWRDRSDTQALQFVRYDPLQPPGLPGPAAYPTSPSRPRAADWDANKEFKFDQEFVQPSLRIDWALSDVLTLTSISAYSHFRTQSRFDGDGTSFEIQDVVQFGKIEDFNQEIRLGIKSGGLTGVIGGSYENSRIRETLFQKFFYLSNVQNIGGSGISLIDSTIFSRSRTDAKAVFANVDYKVDDQFSFVLGGRYTRTSIDFRGCALDSGTTLPNTPAPGVTADARQFFNGLYGILTGNVGANPIQPGGCITLDNISRGGNPPTFLPTESPSNLTEDNFSWNATVNFKPSRNALLYARVAQGYKAGSFPTIAASTSMQFRPAKQEGLRAYEAGFKLTLADRTVQFDGAAFYYDYKDKQLSNFIPDAVFGPLIAIVNIPKSRVAGGEASISWTPVRGLTLSGSATYVDTKIRSFTGFDQRGNVTNFQGAPFNFAPKWSGTADANYRFALNPQLTATAGGGLSFHSKTTGIIGTSDPAYDIASYTLVDVQVGLEGASGWSLQLWGKNITNKYYWTNVNRIGDNIARAAGYGATYGATAGYRF